MLNNEQSAGTIAEQGTNADDMHVSPAIGNTNVGSSPSVYNHREMKFRYRLQCLTKNGLEEWFEIHTISDLEKGSFVNSATAKIISIDQFTGSSDKNSQEIYEGDIIRGILYYAPCEFLNQEAKLVDEVGVVQFEEFMWQLWNESEYERGLISRYDTIEVIGNICQNPELLSSVQ